MKKCVCKICGREFVNTATRRPRVYCSPECTRQAATAKNRKHRAKIRAEAKRLGISIVACRLLHRKKKRPPCGVEEYHQAPAATKSYAEIVAENRRRKVQSGWRGQVVLGGGSAAVTKMFEVAEV